MDKFERKQKENMPREARGMNEIVRMPNVMRYDAYGYEELVMDQFSEMYNSMKEAVLGEYFASESLNRNGDIHDWHDDLGFKFSARDPLVKALEHNQLRVMATRVTSEQPETCNGDVNNQEDQ